MRTRIGDGTREPGQFVIVTTTPLEVVALPAGRIDQLLIVTVMPAEVVVLPVASRAVAVSVWAPLAPPRESHDSEYLVGVRSVVVAAPRSCPSNWKRTSASSRSSTAVAVSVTAPVSVAFAAGVNSDTTGDPTSGSAGG